MKVRNYAREYKQYHGRPIKIKERSARNKARRIMVKIVGKKRMKGKHIDHKNHKPLDNRVSNLRLRSASANMADNKHKT
jgi:ABC-type transporter MlaC component